MPDLARHAGSDAERGRAAGHIFLSYASEDAGVARLLADELTRLGHRVWWDRLIAGGAQWGPEIARALDEARAVVVLWSPAAVASHFVRAEARTALERRTFIPAIIEPCELPLPFGEFQAIDLTAWRAAGDAAALDGLRRALDRVEPEAAGARADDRGDARGAKHGWRAAASGYASDLVHMITGPKAFLRQRSAESTFAAAAVRFFVISLAIQLAIGLPIALKIGGSLQWEIVGAALYQPARMLLMGIAVHLAWRAIGGRAPALKTIAAFAYVYGLLILLFACTQNLAVGLLRAVDPNAAERVFAIGAGRSPEPMTEVMLEEGVAASAALLSFASSPLILVPLVCWGAFRELHQVSRLRSVAAAMIALVLGAVAWAVTVMLSYIGPGPG